MKKLKFSIISLLICFHCSFVLGNPVSNTIDDNFTKGIDLFKSGRFQESYEILLKAFEDSPGNLELNFYLGRAAFEINNYEIAVMAFERILMAAPNENRVKLEIARAFHRLGANDIARQYCKEVLASNPPEIVKTNINNFLLYIDKTEQAHFLSGQFMIGVDWNNNIWASPSSRSIRSAIGNIQLTGASAQKTQDWIYNTTLRVDHTYRFPYSDHSWKTQAVLYNAIYDVTDELDIRFFGGYTGPQFVSGKNRYSIMLLLNNLELDDDEYFKSAGSKAAWDHIFNTNFVVRTELKYEFKEFPETPERDSKNTSLSLNLGINYKNNWFNINLKAEDESADNDEYNYVRFGSNISITRELPFKTKGSVDYYYQYSAYDEEAFLFNKKRQDHQHYAGISLEKKIWKSSLKTNQSVSLKLNYRHTWAYSNIGLYEYNADLVQVSMIYNF